MAEHKDFAPLRHRLADILEDFISSRDGDGTIDHIISEVRNLESLRANPSLDDIPTPWLVTVLDAITGPVE